MASGGNTIRDGVVVANESSSPAGPTAVVPDWKRELIERRKSLAKTAAPVPTGHSHSQRSSREQASATSPVSSPTAAATGRSSSASSPTSAATTDLSRSHTATPTNGTTTTAAAAAAAQSSNSKLDFSAGKSFDQVTSPLSSCAAFSRVSSSSAASSSTNSGRISAGSVASPDREDAAPAAEAFTTRETSLIVGNISQSAHLKNGQKRNISNHHNSNCAADNNNQKRNTDDSEQQPQQPSVRSASSSSSSSSSQSVVVGSVLGGGGGRVVKKPESQTLGRSSSGSSAVVVGHKDSSLSGKSINNNNNKKMVAQEVCESAAMDAALAIGGSVMVGQCSSPDGGLGDGIMRQDYEAAEELKYGPGIVQKLRSRFMSYTMRLNAAKNQRPSLQNMRRATSLNNLLDDDEDSTRTASPVHSAAGGEVAQNGSRGRVGDAGMDRDEADLISHRHSMGTTNGFGQRDVVVGAGSAGDSQCDGLKKYQNEMLRSRQLRRGNESLKRARSVETLRYDSKAWERDVQMTTNNDQLMEVIMGEEKQPHGKDMNMEDRIVKAKERGDPRPTRLKPFIDVTERPPPDLVKTTLMKFEATANRRGRAPTSRNGEVAAKVAILEKPAILHPKPPLSPKKPVIKPRTSVHNHSPLVGAKQQQQQQQALRSPSPLLINVEMTYKQSTPAAGQDRRNGSNLLASPPQTPPDLINSIGGGGVRKESNGASAVANNHHLQHLIQQQQQAPTNGGGYESPITQLTNKLKSMQLQSPVTAGGGGVKSSRLIDNTTSSSSTSNGGGIVGGGRRSGSSSNSSASTATSSATSSPVPHSAASGSYYLNGCGSSVAGRLELGDVSAEDCYEYRDYDDEDGDEEEEEHDENSQDKQSQPDRVIDADEVANTDHDDQNDGDQHSDSDEDQADNGSERMVRLINKADLQSIGQAGTTQEFRFGNNGSTNKSHLPVVPPRTTGAKNKSQQQQLSAGDKMRFVPSGGVGGGATDLKKGKNGHSVVQEIVLVTEEGPCETDVDECKTTTALLIKQIKEETTRKCGGPGPRDNQVNGGVVHNQSLNLSNHNNHSNGNGHSNHSVRNGNSDTTSTTTTTNRQREIEKNLINVGKSELKEQPQPRQPHQQPQSSAAAPPPAKKKSWQEEPQANTMVFNFSKRKDVPDYIDSDGMILLPHRKRELPKPGESGFVVLGDLSLETSTDPDDAWTMGPPSPCNIVFENDNVIIEGKSNLRKQLNRSKQWSIRFDDSLTSTFEYVSETSILEAYDDDVDSSSGDSQMSLHNGQKFMTISSAPLGSYTPIKGSVANNFELGVTKSPSPGSSSVSMSPSPTQSKEEQQLQLARNGGGDPESLQYLKPATDDETVAWSRGTSATDLLF